MSETIIITDYATCPVCGIVQSWVSQRDWWHLEDAMNLDEDEIRTDAIPTALSEWAPDRVWFCHGGGYDWIDNDLLGGTGDGVKHREAINDHGFTFETVDEEDEERYETCNDCSGY